MTASVFETLRYAKRLTKAGVAPEQAEAMTEALAVEFVPNLVTRTDLGNAVSGLESEFKADIAALGSRPTWRLLGGVALIVGLAVALVKLA